MYFLTPSRERVELIPINTTIVAEDGRLAIRSKSIDDPGSRLSHAASAFFNLGKRTAGQFASKAQAQKEKPVGVFREKQSGLLRMVRKEIVMRLTKGISAKKRDQIFKKYHLVMKGRSEYVRQEYVVQTAHDKWVGTDLVERSNKLMDLDEVVFAVPNFVSEFQRQQIPVEQWHLKNRALVSGQLLGEDVDAEAAWSITKGKPSITVSVLDDGVDVDHPNLRSRIKKNPDPNEPRDKCGRDFFIPDLDHPEHFNPRPKLFQFPFDQMTGNDIHGTPCAGIIAAPGISGGALGIAPNCRVLPVKIFHADSLAADRQVAEAIRYASLFSDVLSCSWSGGSSPAIETAISDAGTQRNGKGAAVFCAAGNGFANPVSFPARLYEAIAVGASTDQGKLANYSNIGPELSFVAPSSGGVQGIYTTDVSIPNRGFNVGLDSMGGADGLHTNDFGGTSAATPLAAGIAALLLSKDADLDRESLWEILAITAKKIGSGYDADGHSNRFGHGRVNAAAALAELD